MLFSHPRIAALINQKTEPAWESVRPVPQVTIDFGNGEVVRRTLQGNIATWVTDSKGRIVDVLPGIYDAESYLRALRPVIVQAQVVGKLEDDEFTRRMTTYHRIARSGPALFGTMHEIALDLSAMPVGKGMVERPVKKLVAAGATPFAARNGPGVVETPRPGKTPKPLPPDVRIALAKDARKNEQRRRAIHEHLLERPLTRVETETRWLFAKVLHVDLDDRWLGLGKTLFGPDPFGDADYHRKKASGKD